jgi:hypothetical protein
LHSVVPSEDKEYIDHVYGEDDEEEEIEEEQEEKKTNHCTGAVTRASFR